MSVRPVISANPAHPATEGAGVRLHSGFGVHQDVPGGGITVFQDDDGTIIRFGADDEVTVPAGPGGG